MNNLQVDCTRNTLGEAFASRGNVVAQTMARVSLRQLRWYKTD